MNIKEKIEYKLARGYTMAIYGTLDNLHEEMRNDIEELINYINTKESKPLPRKNIKRPKNTYVKELPKTPLIVRILTLGYIK